MKIGIGKDLLSHQHEAFLNGFSIYQDQNRNLIQSCVS